MIDESQEAVWLADRERVSSLDFSSQKEKCFKNYISSSTFGFIN
jgi:hypothetical protein